MSVVARGLDRPWSLLILPDGDMLVSMRYSNQIRAIRKGALDPKPLTGLPPMRRLFDIVDAPEVCREQVDLLRVFQGGRRATARRWCWRAAATTVRRSPDVQDLYVSDPVTQGASRMAFAPDGTIYMTVSGAGGRHAKAGPIHANSTPPTAK